MSQNIVIAGKENGAAKALIMIHGRGGSAEDILSLAAHLNIKDYLLLGPQAKNNTWYPRSFIAPVAENEPSLSEAIKLVGQAVELAIQKGISKENIYFLGFSQGACLTTEYIARNATKYGGAVAFTGGLIGEHINQDNYSGNFNGTPVFLGTSNPDFHVPVERVYATANILKEMGAEVYKQVYNNMGHTINQDEIDRVNKLIFK